MRVVFELFIRYLNVSLFKYFIFFIFIFSNCNALTYQDSAFCENTHSIILDIFRDEHEQCSSYEFVQEDINSDIVSKNSRDFEATSLPVQFDLAEKPSPSMEDLSMNETTSLENPSRMMASTSVKTGFESASLEQPSPQASIYTTVTDEAYNESAFETKDNFQSQGCIETSPASKEGISSEAPIATHVASEEKRFNFASTDCAAAVLKTNPEAEGASSILTENKDKYMLNKCSAAKKFVIIELCEDIYVDTVQIANFEFFSSIFRTIRISVSGKYPKHESSWMELGTFTAMNLRTLQSFHIENPLIWAKYMKIEVLSHYGSEFYCPLSLVHVFGKTMIEEFEEENEDEYSNGSNPSQNIQADSLNAKAKNDSQAFQSEQTASASNTVQTEIYSQNSAMTAMNAATSSPPESKNSVIEEDQGLCNSYKDYVTSSLSSSIVTGNVTSSAAVSSPFPTTTHHLNQESVYKNINKRLYTLEERKKVFDEAIQKVLISFGKHDAKQLNFSGLLNEISMSYREEFEHLRYQSQRLQSSFYILQARLELASAENEFIQRRIQSLSDDSSFQKRLLVLQLTLLIVLVVYIAVSYFPANPSVNGNVLLQSSSVTPTFDSNDDYRHAYPMDRSELTVSHPSFNSKSSNDSSVVYKFTENTDDEQPSRSNIVPVPRMKPPAMKKFLHSRSYSVY
ncbi:Sad1-UNC-like carboxy terminal protein [Schizosaccharomyces cryophilus OY26]|uniref:SUN-like protein 1 n=1 Tax=Schizosaccharomyces cryophilus (strain OY26 / ATCC MYA-4695 / CBS 11777 / NBRC 106824 / NRRL Y48691) TaxID=653667 RepID=S9XJJ9_SCHCR|nr:Sad1-UNC-like carboxy terminal protein [Schizosaccharomyces cryophilus OY26]EPY53871.1 Sad1-UNC-like carboxy terminal protein [Schizosaccharomyces cryophilus OY26]